MHKLIFILTLIYLTPMAAYAQTAAEDSEMLNGEALKTLMFKGPWKTVTHMAGRRDMWIWGEDNTVCLKLTQTDDGAECDHKGTWTLTDNVLCYELDWASEETKADRNHCITVKQTGENLYSRFTHGDAFPTKLFDFKMGPEQSDIKDQSDAKHAWTPMDITQAYLNQNSDKVITILEATLPEGKEGLKQRSEALLTAAEKGDLKVTEYLIDKGVDHDVRDDRGNTPLHIACAEQQADVANFLIENGSDIHALNNLYKRTPLLIAATFGLLDTVKKLVDNGAEIGATDYIGKTALHWSAIPWSYNKVGGDALMVYLIEQGLDINQRDAAGNTVLGDPIIQNESGEQFDKIRADLKRLGGKI